VLCFDGCYEPSVVINNFDLVCISTAPHETDPPLIVDANAVLTLSSSVQRLQTVTRRSGQIAQLRCTIELPQFSTSHPFNCPKAPAGYSLMQSACLGTTERLNHSLKYITYRMQRPALRSLQFWKGYNFRLHSSLRSSGSTHGYSYRTCHKNPH
jgi:hypothetical protein